MSWSNPLRNKEYVGISNDPDSFKNIDVNTEYEIPVGKHCGAFGAVRKHDVHKGVDLYCPVGTPVFAVEDGTAVDVRQFTGAALGFPWWNDTWAISIEGESGVAVYGEIEVVPDLTIGTFIERGTIVGNVLQVLSKDKGRPMSMLHFALHRKGVLRNGRWKVGAEQPCGLLDPTHQLLKSI